MRDDIADAATPVLPIFTAADYVKLCENEYSRYVPNSPLIGHVLVGPDGKACQFRVPYQLDKHPDVPGVVAPKIGNLTHLSQFQLPNNKKTLLGYIDNTPEISGRAYSRIGNIPMLSRRAYSLSVAHLEEEPVNYTFYPLSPRKNPITEEDIVYDTARVERFRNTKAVQAEIQEIQSIKKTGETLVVSNADVLKRMAIKTRKPDQNTVMGRHAVQKMMERHEDVVLPGRASHSAVEEMRHFLEHYRDILTPDMIAILTRSVRAPLTGYGSQPRAEWLHRDGHNLHPMHKDPQYAGNLGAAEKRYNTEMMIGERAVQFFALNVPQSRSTIKCDFDMLLDSDVVDMIHFVACIRVADFTFKITLNIDAFQKEPQSVKASDLATLVGILFCFMHHKAPRSILPIKNGDAAVYRSPQPFGFFKVGQAAANSPLHCDADEDEEELLYQS
jgi:hypothetical protein